MQLERIEEVPFEADFSQDAMQLLEIKRDAMLLATPRTSPISMENESKSDTKSFRQKFGKGTAAKKVLGGTPQTPPLSDGPKTKRAQVKNACGNLIFLFLCL